VDTPLKASINSIVVGYSLEAAVYPLWENDIALYKANLEGMALNLSVWVMDTKG